MGSAIPRARTRMASCLVLVTIALAGTVFLYRNVDVPLSLYDQYYQQHQATTKSSPLAGIADLVHGKGPPDCVATPKPNLILSSIDGETWQDVIFKFMHSLEISLGRDALSARRAGECLPAQVEVKIIVPEGIAANLPPSFKALQKRYSHLDFVGALPDGGPSVLTRFLGWSALLEDIGSRYDRVLITDLDVIFQRNPFTTIQFPQTVDLQFYTEWRGIQLGQQRTHLMWHQSCIDSMGGQYESHDQYLSYGHEKIVSDGTQIGTVDAMRVYVDLMAADVQRTEFQCNDQAMTQHIYYSGALAAALQAAGLGSAVAVANEEADVATLSFVPLVRYNHWGEVLSETGKVHAIVHCFSPQPKLVAFFNERYGWKADPGSAVVPEMPELVENESWATGMEAAIAAWVPSAEAPEKPVLYRQFPGYADMSVANCSKVEDLCSCRNEGCHLDYAPHII